MVIWLHLVSALLALGLGTTNLVLAKGTRRHRAVGAVWIAAMLCVTVSSFWIRELNPGALSWIHGLTVWTLFSMGVAVWAIRTGASQCTPDSWWERWSVRSWPARSRSPPGRFIGRLLGY